MTDQPLSFDPSLLPDPMSIAKLRMPPSPSPTPTADWYTPMILFGQLGTSIQPGVVGRIPIIFPCLPIGWYMSANAPCYLTTTIQLANPPDFDTGIVQDTEHLTVAVGDTPEWTEISGQIGGGNTNLPQLQGFGRTLYEQTPWLVDWPPVLNRYAELQITVVTNGLVDTGTGVGVGIAEQVLLVLYLKKLRVR